MTGSPGRRIVFESGAFDLVIVSTGEPVAVVAVGDTSETPLAAMTAVFFTIAGAPTGSATR